MRKLISVLAIATAIAACGQPATPGANEAAAAPSEGAAAPAAAADATAITQADKTAILTVLSAHPDARGQVINACEEKVTPSFHPVDLGGAVGVAILAIIPGGPNTLTCYGDGPGDMHVMRRTGAGFTDIYPMSGAYLVVLPSTHHGVRDIVEGGPGFSHPLAWWNGSAYEPHGQISDQGSSAGAIYPQE